MVANLDAGFWTAIIAAIFAGLTSLLNAYNARAVGFKVQQLDAKTEGISGTVHKAVKLNCDNSDKLDEISQSSAQTAAVVTSQLQDIHTQGNSNWDKSMAALADANKEIAALREAIGRLQERAGADTSKEKK